MISSEYGQFHNPPLLPGIKPVLELLSSNPQRINCIYCKKSLNTSEIKHIQNICKQKSIKFSLVNDTILSKLCHGTINSKRIINHQGIIARLNSTSFCSLESLFSQTQSSPLPVILALDQVQDPGNIGTLCRTLYALGGSGIIIPKHNSAYIGPAAYKSSAGALEKLSIACVTNLAHALDSAEEAGFIIYGTDCNQTNSANIFTQTINFPSVLVLGNEQKGLRPVIRKRCSSMLHIPMSRSFDSLNVAQAGAILLAFIAKNAFTSV